MKTAKHRTALAFLLLTAVMIAYWAAGAAPQIRAAGLKAFLFPNGVPAGSFAAKAEAFTGQAEHTVDSTLDRDKLFIQLYGGLERLSGRRVLQDADPHYNVVKLSDGALSFLPNHADDAAQQSDLLARLNGALTLRGIPLLYVQAPCKLAPDDPRLPEGTSETANAYATSLLADLQKQGVASFDLRETFARAEGSWGDYFFRTDHHWNVRGAFLAWQTVSGLLERDYGLAVDPASADRSSYTSALWKHWFLGSQGKRVGSLYAGTDDFEVWTPNYDTAFHYVIPIAGLDRTGSFSETLLFPDYLNTRDLFQGNPYLTFSGGDYGYTRIENLTCPDGPNILLVRDSYSCAFPPFLALGCGSVTTVDLRYLPQGDTLLKYVDQTKPDLVLFLYTVSSYELDEAALFPPAP